MSPFPCTKNTLSTVCVHVCSTCRFLRLCQRRNRVVSAFQKNLSMPATVHSAEDCLRLFVHGNVLLTWVSDTQAWMLPLVSDTHACTLLLVSDMQTCVVRSPPNISSKTCHHTLWAALRLNCPCSQAGENLAKKNSKCASMLIQTRMHANIDMEA